MSGVTGSRVSFCFSFVLADLAPFCFLFFLFALAPAASSGLPMASVGAGAGFASDFGAGVVVVVVVVASGAVGSGSGSGAMAGISGGRVGAGSDVGSAARSGRPAPLVVEEAAAGAPSAAGRSVGTGGEAQKAREGNEGKGFKRTKSGKVDGRRGLLADTASGAPAIAGNVAAFAERWPSSARAAPRLVKARTGAQNRRRKNQRAVF